MANIPLAAGDYFRGVAKEARLRLRNRYFEQNPVLSSTQTSLIARPGLRRFLAVGDGPIRQVYSQPGSFEDCLFVASGDQLFRVETDGETVTLIGSIPGTSSTGAVSMAATGTIGETPEYLFVAAGAELMCYIQNGYATGSISGTPANGNVVRIDLVYYQFTSGSVDAGTPDGSSGNPWLVALGANAAEAWDNFSDAIKASGIEGSQYSTGLEENPSATVTNTTSSTVFVRATLFGVVGNAVITTETGSNIAWAQGGTLTGGGDPSYFQVDTPDDIGIISLGYVASHVVCVPAQGEGINGRFYWIRPAETEIDPLDFATAERSPDPITSVVVFGDQFWLPGTATTEVWYFTGQPDSPVARVQGVVFDRGAWEGTAIQVKESMVTVDPDGGVFQIAGQPVRISSPDIEERIRKAIAEQALQI